MTAKLDFTGGTGAAPLPPTQPFSSEGVPLNADAPVKTAPITHTVIESNATIGMTDPLSATLVLTPGQAGTQPAGSFSNGSFGPSLVDKDDPRANPKVPGALGNTAAPTTENSGAGGNFR